MEEMISNLNQNKLYKERIVEITTSGEYISADDGTEVVIQPGYTKVYIFYEEY